MNDLLTLSKTHTMISFVKCSFHKLRRELGEHSAETIPLDDMMLQRVLASERGYELLTMRSSSTLTLLRASFHAWRR